MAKKHVVKERVALVSPKGTRVTVGVDQATRMRSKGYRAVDGSPAPAPEPTSTEPASTPDPKVDPKEQKGSGDTKDAPERPNRGASLASWAAFADHLGVEYPDGAGRDEVRDLVEAAHPAE